MRKILVFGNSGSGKSTLAKHLAASEKLAHLDLDTLAWMPPASSAGQAEETPAPQRAPLHRSKKTIDAFMQQYNNWVIEGCYTDLLELAAREATEILFLNLSVDQCVENARNRPWEPYKYASKQAQDNNLDILIEWIQAYTTRNDEFSHAAHSGFYEKFSGKKAMRTANSANGQKKALQQEGYQYRSMNQDL